MKLVVNSLGEALGKTRHGLIAVAGSVNLTELEGRLKRIPTAADTKKEFQRMVNESALTAEQKRIVKLVWRAQDRLNNERIRVQYYSGAIRVSTEFMHPVADKDFWRKVRQAARDLGARITFMDETVNNEYSYRTGKKGQKIRGSEKYGPRFGQLERQVDLNLPVRKLSLTAIRKAYSAVERATKAVWETGGIGIV